MVVRETRAEHMRRSITDAQRMVLWMTWLVTDPNAPRILEARAAAIREAIARANKAPATRRDGA